MSAAPLQRAQVLIDVEVIIEFVSEIALRQKVAVREYNRLVHFRIAKDRLTGFPVWLKIRANRRFYNNLLPRDCHARFMIAIAVEALGDFWIVQRVGRRQR